MCICRVDQVTVVLGIIYLTTKTVELVVVAVAVVVAYRATE